MYEKGEFHLVKEPFPPKPEFGRKKRLFFAFLVHKGSHNAQMLLESPPPNFNARLVPKFETSDLPGVQSGGQVGQPNIGQNQTKRQRNAPGKMDSFTSKKLET